MTFAFPKLPLPGWRDWLFAAKMFAASMLALYIALAAGLPRPYWAMATVYIVANPLSGATRSKAFFRLGGTVIGAAAAVFFLPPLVNMPLVMSAVVAVWTGTLLFISFLDRSPRAYLFMLSGYTLPLIALPAVGDPTQVFDIATARALEIGIGIICASLIHSLVLPSRVGPIVGARATAWLASARGWLSDVLKGESTVSVEERTRALVGEMTALDGLISQLAYDPAMTLVVRHARALRLRMAMLMPLASSLTDRLDAVRRTGAMPLELASVAADLDELLATTGVGAVVPAGAADDALTKANFARSRAQSLRARIAALKTQNAEAGDWHSLLVASALERMSELLDLWQDCTRLEAEVTAGRRARQRVELVLPDVTAVAPHFDWPMMIFSAVSVMGAAFSASLIWIYTGWSQGAAFVMIAAVACSFFATADAPVPMIRMFIKWTVVSCIVAGIYIFAILPGIDSYPGLVAVFAVPFLLFGLLITKPQTMMIGMLVGVNLATLMSLQEVYSADFETFTNGAIATVAGGIYALVWMSITRPFGSALMARRLVRAGWNQIADAAAGRMGITPHLFTGRVFDRLGQLVPRLAAGRALDTGPAEILAEMRIGLNVIDLVGSLSHTAPALRTELRAVLDRVHDFFAAQAGSGRRMVADAGLMARIDAAIVAVLAGSRLKTGLSIASGKPTEIETRRGVLSALIGLRLGLYPYAPPPDDLDGEHALIGEELADKQPAFVIAAE